LKTTESIRSLVCVQLTSVCTSNRQHSVFTSTIQQNVQAHKELDQAQRTYVGLQQLLKAKAAAVLALLRKYPSMESAGCTFLHSW